MKITVDTKQFPGVPQHFWDVMSDGDELLDFNPDYSDAFFGVDACPASGGGGRTAAPAAATAPGAVATPAPSFPAVDPAEPFCCVNSTTARVVAGC